MKHLRRVLMILTAFSHSAMADTTAAPLSLEIEPDQKHTINLVDETQLKGPYLLVAGPRWVSVNAQGVLLLNPAQSDVGTHDVKLEVKSGSTWVELAVQVEVRFFKYGVKIFTAPWCQACRELVPGLEDSIAQSMSHRRVELKVYLETDYDLYEPPTQATADDYKRDLALNSEVVADEWQWKEYRKYFPKGFKLPAAVVYREGEKHKELLGPGHFTSRQVMAALAGLMNMNFLKTIDVLWVVDNSGSMAQYQNLLGSVAQSLFRSLEKYQSRWRMGMITTDPVNAPVLPLSGGNVLTWYSTDVAKRFSAGALGVGTGGNGIEQPLSAIRTHLTAHPQFLQSQSELRVVVVSDEDDQSKTTTQEYLQFLARWTGDIRRVRQYGLLAAPDLGCAATGGNWAYGGSRQEEVIRFTRGKTFPLCELHKNVHEFARHLAGLQ